MVYIQSIWHSKSPFSKTTSWTCSTNVSSNNFITVEDPWLVQFEHLASEGSHSLKTAVMLCKIQELSLKNYRLIFSRKYLNRLLSTCNGVINEKPLGFRPLQLKLLSPKLEKTQFRHDYSWYANWLAFRTISWNSSI